MIFNVQKCSDDQELEGYSDYKCADESEVNQFIEDLTVEVWTLTEKIDFHEVRFAKPIYFIL
jgi:hypothetical protein